VGDAPLSTLSSIVGPMECLRLLLRSIGEFVQCKPEARRCEVKGREEEAGPSRKEFVILKTISWQSCGGMDRFPYSDCQ
jgi:hypothetical protein